MTRILAIGDFHYKNSRLFREPRKYDVEWFHIGPGKAPPPNRSFAALARDVAAGAFDLVVAFDNPFPFSNPRKSLSTNTGNLLWRGFRNPNILRGLLATRLYPRVKTRLAAIDLSDSPGIQNYQFGLLRWCHVYFKRELPQNPSNAFLFTTAKNECNGNVQRQPFFARAIPKLRPISLGIDPAPKYEALSRMGKTVDIFYAGNVENRPLRQRGLRQIKALEGEGIKVDIASGRLPKEEFLRRCAQALLVWSPEGFGWDCYRDYEVALCASVPVKNFPTICRHAPLMDGVHALYYGIEGEHLQNVIRAAVRDPQRCIEMGRAAREHVLLHHTHEALADYVVAESLAPAALMD